MGTNRPATAGPALYEASDKHSIRPESAQAIETKEQNAYDRIRDRPPEALSDVPPPILRSTATSWTH
jgi:hypothetical protein